MCVCQYISENLHLIHSWGVLRALSAGVFSFAPMHTYQNTNQKKTHTPLPYLRRSFIIVPEKKKSSREWPRQGKRERESERTRARENMRAIG